MFTNKEIFKKEFERRIIEKYGRGVSDSHITEKYDVLTQLEHSADKQIEAEILRLKKILKMVL